MKDKLLDVVENTTAFFDSVQNRGEVVVGQNDIGSV
jgi:hypothetical protein